jgi:site-specific recombinase XerD
MATIYTRKAKDGTRRYYCDLTVEGRRYRRYLGLSRSTADKALISLEHELRFVQQGGPERLGWDATLRQFILHVELTGITPAQVKYIKSRLNAFKSHCKSIDILSLDKVTTSQCRDYLTKRSQMKLRNKYQFGLEDKWVNPSISTLNIEIGFQKRFFRFCTENNWLDRNPWDPVKRIKDRTKGKPRYHFTDSDLNQIFEIGGVFNDFYFFLLHTGVRSTDAFVLDSKSIESQKLTIRMRKTGDWLPSIPLSLNVLNRLDERLSKGGMVFPELQSDRQRRNARNLIQSQFRPDEVRTNIINLHTFRHTYAHRMLAQGMPKEVLQVFLGHRSIRTTEIYANWICVKNLEKWVDISVG